MFNLPKVKLNEYMELGVKKYPYTLSSINEDTNEQIGLLYYLEMIYENKDIEKQQNYYLENEGITIGKLKDFVKENNLFLEKHIQFYTNMNIRSYKRVLNKKFDV